MSIYVKLAAIQNALVAPKGQFNSFGGFSYRSCEDVLKALKPLCKEQGCVLFISNEMKEIGSRNYVEARVTLVDLETGEELHATAHAREEESKKGMDGSQITGASSSYARKYALAGLFCIDNEKDSDATCGEEKTLAMKISKVKANAMLKRLQNADADKLKAANISMGAIKALYKVDSIEDLTEDQHTDLAMALEKAGV